MSAWSRPRTPRTLRALLAVWSVLLATGVPALYLSGTRGLTGTRGDAPTACDAGHLITPMLQPTTFRHATGPYIPVGGSPAGYARADRDASGQVLAFLARALAVDPAAGRPAPAPAGQ